MNGRRVTVRVGILPHRERAAALELAHEAATWLETHGATAVLPKAEADLVGLPALGVDPAEFPDGLDVVMSLGGDGTMLRTIDLVYEAGVAVLGVNVGQMGYLTEVEPADLDVALERLLVGDYHVEERMMLAIDVRSSGPAGGRWFALNETVIEKARTGHMVRLDVEINGAFFTTYAADGVIVATPTGLHRVLLLRPGADRVPAAPVPAAHAGVAAHAVRPVARARRGRGRRDHGHRRDRRGDDRRRPRGRLPRPRRRRRLHRGAQAGAGRVVRAA